MFEPGLEGWRDGIIKGNGPIGQTLQKLLYKVILGLFKLGRGARGDHFALANNIYIVGNLERFGHIMSNNDRGTVEFVTEIANELCGNAQGNGVRSEEHTSELQSRGHLVCRLLLETKKKQIQK